jgi:N-ethylmaleimide reductase
VPFIANPDVVERFRRGAPSTPPYYGSDARGYTDYPSLSERLDAK